MWLGESGRRVSNPLPTAWKAVALPNELLPLFFEWERKDSNLRRLRQQIYSLPHLAALELSQKKRAGRRIRTADQLITNQLLWPTELHRLFLVYFQSTFSLLRDCKNTTFFFTKIKNIHFFIFFYNYQKIK